MASLTQTAIFTRKIIRYSIFAIIFLILARITLNIGIKAFRHFFPKPPPPPTVSFGKLPKLPFPEKQKLEFTYTLETPEGTLPNLPSQTKVYFMPKLSPNLLSLDFAKEKARALGFLPQEQEVSQTTYRFPSKNSSATLEINIVSGIFSISYDLGKDSSPLERKPPPPEIAASGVRSILSSANLLPADLSGPTTHQFLKQEGDKFVGALSLSEADLVKINFFRKSYDDLPSLTPDPDKGNVWFIVGGSYEREKQIIAAEFHYFPVDTGKSSTYPLKLAQEAWDELNSQGAYIGSFGLNKSGEDIKIRRIYLAYYDPPVPSEFYQPVVVFEGDRGFMAYVPAVTTDYYGE